MSEYEFMDIFGDNLRDSLTIAKMTQSELARRSNITEVTISRYINKQRFPTLRNIINIAVALHCRLDDLIPVYDHIYGVSRR